MENNTTTDFSHSHGISWTRDRLIGEGAYGSVFLAKKRDSTDADSRLPMEIAVKSSFMQSSSSLRREKEILLDLHSSYNVVSCFGDEITETASGEKVYNLLMEYCSGSSLHDRIVRMVIPESEVRRYTRDIVHGLCYIHSKGYIHCDIKLENILLQPSDFPADRGCLRAKIADFGLARKMDGDVIIKELIGTRSYMSPELVKDGHLDWPVDVWALGCVVVEMLSGRPAWSCGNIHEDLLSRIGYSDELPDIPLTISAEARDFLESIFIRSPYKRPPSWLLIKHPFVAD